ncbi:MAG: patatin-like phospholipase family protein [Candidatus Melainabacteria bacterium]|nr:patatin-like phospholipase family protein [Candidatus Melainabacteria bacterium]
MATSDNRDESRPVRALVLSGGGGRGAYEAGVAKACAERDFHFDWIVGTSIGALNAALVGQDDLEMLETMWRKIRTSDVYKLPDPGHLRRVIFGQQLGLLNTDPLEKLLRSSIDINKLKAGKTKVGFVTTDLCGLHTRVITGDEIDTQDDLIDVLMASSAIPLLFPPRRLHGEGCWMDGGLVRNTPIQAAISLGATEIYAVLVEPNSVDTCPTSMMQLVSRLLEIVFDHSARSGIAHVTQHNRIIEVGGFRNGSGNWCLLDDAQNGNNNGDHTAHGNGAGNAQSPGDGFVEHEFPGQAKGRDAGSAFDFVDLSQPFGKRKRVSLFMVKPERQILGSLLEIDPVISNWLLKMGYEDVLRKCEAAVV